MREAERLWETLAGVCGSMSIGSDMSNVFDPIEAALRKARNDALGEARDACELNASECRKLARAPQPQSTKDSLLERASAFQVAADVISALRDEEAK